MSETMNEQIKPCIFCGEPNEVSVVYTSDDKTWFVECGWCRSRGPKIISDVFDKQVYTKERASELAIQQWNKGYK